jgi:pimeloyl-ACP methyl ester carboxylesterase
MVGNFTVPTIPLCRCDVIRVIIGLTLIIHCLSLSATGDDHKADQSPSLVRSDVLVDIGTHKIRVVVSEIESEYTVILEAGGGNDSDSYQKIQDSLAMLTGTRVISYDRSGFGKSELGPDKFDAGDEVDALKKCLELQGYKDRLILVGLSYGGFLIQIFADRYPELVSGLVLLDPMNVRFVDSFGLDRLNAITPYFDPPTNNREKAGNRMVDAFSASLELLRGKDIPDTIPVILLTAGNFPIENDLWRKCHEEMVSKSDLQEQRIAEGVGHDILRENPQLVLETVAELISIVKAKQQPGLMND